GGGRGRTLSALILCGEDRRRKEQSEGEFTGHLSPSWGQCSAIRRMLSTQVSPYRQRSLCPFSATHYFSLASARACAGTELIGKNDFTGRGVLAVARRNKLARAGGENHRSRNIAVGRLYLREQLRVVDFAGGIYVHLDVDTEFVRDFVPQRVG